MQFLSMREHTILGTLVGVVLLFAPNIFGFNDVGGAAVTIPRILGIIIILSELTVRGSYSGMGFVSSKLHIAIDVLLGVFLAISPWLFSFSGEKSNAWVPHLVAGILIMGYALVTRTSEDAVKGGHHRGVLSH
jgi:hypothetical protein